MDIVNFLLELMDVMNQLFAMIGDGTNANLLLIQQLFKTSVEKVLYHQGLNQLNPISWNCIGFSSRQFLWYHKD